MVNEQQTVAERCKRGCSDRDAARCWPLGTVRKGPCSCACHPKSEPLTPSEVALAKMLAAWEEWPGDLGHHRETLFGIGRLLEGHALISEGQPSADGRALLDRARKAGVL